MTKHDYGVSIKECPRCIEIANELNPPPYVPKGGDRVKFSGEGVVESNSCVAKGKVVVRYPNGFSNLFDENAKFELIEAAKPPVVTFKPTQKVRRLTGYDSGTVRILANNGYINLDRNNTFYFYADGADVGGLMGTYCASEFTSDRFELVTD